MKLRTRLEQALALTHWFGAQRPVRGMPGPGLQIRADEAVGNRLRING